MPLYFCKVQKLAISLVVPLILALDSSLEAPKPSRYSNSLIRELQHSLHDRFAGMFERIKSPSVKNGPFGDDIYFIVLILDPIFGMR